MKKIIPSALVITFCFSVSLAAKPQKLGLQLDPLIDSPKIESITPESMSKILELNSPAKAQLFDWLDEEKTRAIFKRNKFTNSKINFTLEGGSIPIDEAVVDFKEGKFEGITISVFNRGDSGKISIKDFEERKKVLSEKLTEIIGKKPRIRKGNIKRGVMTSGAVWESDKGKAVLVHNIEAPSTIEFLRLRFAPASAEGIYDSALEDRSFATVRKSDLSDNVVEKGDNVFIGNLPMVDQGSKGYCVVASAQRLFEYYGIACDMHQLAQLAKSDPKNGTSSLIINKELGAIDYLFQTRFKCIGVKHGNKIVKLKDDKYVGKEISKSSLFRTIYSSIDKGIPLLWSLELGLKPERSGLNPRTKNLNPQASGGHMRMITGYNKKENLIIFSDSWGLGHEYKTMDADDFYIVTTGLFTLVPTGY